VTKVQAFDFDIEYVKGKKKMVADALFRRPSTWSLMEISIDWKSHLLVDYSKNKFACEILDGQVQNDRYRVIGDVIFYKDQVYLAPGLGFRKKILAAVHDSPLSCHQGFFKTYRQVRERFSWKGLKQDVMRHINECVTC
jgi:uracil DNA glycosylase